MNSRPIFDQQLLNDIHQQLKKRGETVAVAESVTSGLLQFAFAQAEFASEFYQGGITAYNLGQKYKHLSVEPIHAQAVNCVSEKVTAELALNVCKLFESHWGIGITGYATTVPESGNRVFAYYAISYKGKIVKHSRIQPRKDDPFNLHLKYAETVINAFAAIVAKHKR